MSVTRTVLGFLAAASLTASAFGTFATASLNALDGAITEAIAANKAPGGILWMEHQGETYRRAYGLRANSPRPEAATEDTLYDAASLTKVLATTPAILQLVEGGKLRLDDPVAHTLAAFGQSGKESVTVRHLLTHTSGLRPGLPADPTWSGREAAIERACTESLRSVPGSAFVYSDINFIVLGELVRLVTGRTLEEYAASEIFSPLKMTDTGFLPAAAKRQRIAPTELVEGTLLRGVVHDPTARRMGGVAGHAGVFTTAADLARFCRMLLGGGQLDGARVLSPASVAEMTRIQIDGSDRRGLGWDIDSRFSSPRGRWFPAGASYGHTGFTGTSLWLDPGAGAFVIFLSNRVHPDGKGDVTALRGTIGTLGAEAMDRHVGAVINGIDVLVREGFAPLRGLKLGLITNQSGRDRQGRSTIDLLHQAPGLQLIALFSPEHGIRGMADAHVGDSVDEKTGLPIHSLYGPTPRRGPDISAADYDQSVLQAWAPRAEHLAGIDALVFDIQDVGARFYTYASTLGVALEVAAREKKKFFVLDRVNPIGGHAVEGPVQTRHPSFIGFHPLPVRHGLTLGELARLLNAERRWMADLTVIPCENWTRETWLDATGLPWMNPSPSMRSLAAATLYPGLCLLEGTSISMARGTSRPFEQVGAPYIDGAKLAVEMNAAQLPGVRFQPVHFVPQTAFYPGPPAALKYRDQDCGGVRVIVTDRERCAVVDVGIALALALQRLYPADFKVDDMARLLGDEETIAALRAGEPLEKIKARWTKSLAGFRERRRPFLLYGSKPAPAAVAP
ncbi:MAG: hypothetical protein RIQ93_635 [Verrucomicrobiota bacterium]|jgi:uncharacterized protein YbbC (DUF1343 family)